ncbi:MAG: hypothetical protein L0226_14685 [Acidobacteria bacterium]|nr:hypothetical protein [Acidobacteriota bacterium]
MADINAMDVITLQKIKRGQSSWGPESEAALDRLAANGYIEILQKHVNVVHRAMDLILVRITDKGINFADGG